MINTLDHSKTINKSEIAVVAYQMWEKAGRPASRDLQFWLEAEAQLRAAAKTVTAPSAAHLSPVNSKNNTVQLGLSQANSSKPQQKVRSF